MSLVLSVFLVTVLVMGIGYAVMHEPDQARTTRSAGVPTSRAVEETPELAPLPTPSSGPTLTAKPEPKPKPTTVLSPPEPPPSLDFVISSFNVLGNSHTTPGGTKKGWAPGEIRARWAASLLAAHDVDVVGFQELQAVQLREFLRVAGGAYDVYPGFSLKRPDTENSIAWRKNVWELMSAETVPIPYFDGHRRAMPVVQLRDRATGLSAYFANFHNPADTKRFPRQQRWRDQATAQEIALVNRLTKQTGLPVLVTGDMNERDEYFCSLTGGTALIAARGGINDGSCQANRPRAVDWIFGSPGVTFSGYTEDRSALVARTTDHPMIVSGVRIEGESTVVAEVRKALAKARRQSD